jgi:hypothetical protein
MCYTVTTIVLGSQRIQRKRTPREVTVGTIRVGQAHSETLARAHTATQRPWLAAACAAACTPEFLGILEGSQRPPHIWRAPLEH